MMTLTIERNGSLDKSVDLLTEAFALEPSTVRFCGHDERRRAAWFDALLRTHATVPGERLLACLDSRPAAVAVTTAPGSAPSLSAQLEWTWRTLRGCGPRSMFRTVDYIRRTEAWKPHDAWTLEFVGVLSTARGQGIARSLLDTAQSAYADAPAFLTTADPRNVELYRGWGFTVCREKVVSGLQVTAMIRAAKG